MRKTIKMIFSATLLAVIIFSMATCGEKTADNGESPYLGGTLTVNEQVWEHTNSMKISEAYSKSAINSNVSIVGQTNDVLGSGKIENGILNFTVGEPEADKLNKWTDLLDGIFREWANVAIDKTDAMGAVINILTAENKPLNRENLVGTNISLGLEYIIYVYTDRDCNITGEHGEGLIPGENYYYTDNVLDLSLKTGWNALWRKEVYSSSGADVVSMEIKNIADFRWAIW